MEVEIVNGVPTHVFSLACGEDRNNSLLLIVPGSPGMGEFYVPFASQLFHLGKGSYDVSVVSHCGHSPGYTNTTFTTGTETDSQPKDWYSLEDQVAHKMAFLKQHENRTFYLVGHSIGCWIVLQMLNQLEPYKVKKVVLLFPTIEKMSVTPNGQMMASLFTTWRGPFTILMQLISFLPTCFKKYVLQWYFYTTPPDHLVHMVQGAININGKCLYNILCMADQEMREVVDIPLDVIDRNIEKLTFYYGSNDKWTLPSCYEDIKARYPDQDINLCDKNYPHAFVESASDEVAQFVYSRLQHDIVD